MQCDLDCRPYCVISYHSRDHWTGIIVSAIGENNVNIVLSLTVIIWLIFVPVGPGDACTVVHVLESTFGVSIVSSNPQIVLLITDQVSKETIVFFVSWKGKFSTGI